MIEQIAPYNQEEEDMNNFIGHMPGDIYRPAESPADGDLRRNIKRLLEKFAPFIDLDEQEWPEDADVELVREIKTGREIQRDIDEFLENDPKLKENWERNKENFWGGGSEALREEILRPIYSVLREKYSEKDLSA